MNNNTPPPENDIIIRDNDTPEPPSTEIILDINNYDLTFNEHSLLISLN